MSMEAITDGLGASQFVSFTREEWARLSDYSPMPLTEAELFALRGLNDQVTLPQVEQVYQPLSRLLNLYVAATQRLHAARDTFLGTSARVPYVIGVAGSVAVGKSTAARILQALLSQWPAHPRVDLVTTDGFLLPNAVLEARGLMQRKGFPESYDVRRLLEFVIDVKSGAPSVKAPVYSHLSYDIVPGGWQEVNRPDIMILEGLNVLQTGPPRQGRSLFVSDFFDFSIYIDAPDRLIQEWYVERFMTLRETVFTDAKSYFHRYASLSDAEARATALRIWREINSVNLKENVEPTRERAHFILEKGENHDMARVRLRKL
jgi:type I pantothenate kinase